MYDPACVLTLDDDALLFPIAPRDVTDGYVAGLNLPAVHRYLVAPRARRQTRASVEAFVADNVVDPRALLFGFYLHGTLCGTSRLHDIERGGSAYIGIALFDPSVWGQGWGTTILRAVSLFAIERFALASTRVHIEHGNVASESIAMLAGYQLVADEY
jgi:RimJ/RimL family protein N-acetyltransferase